jgi:penicillin G amidase
MSVTSRRPWLRSAARVAIPALALAALLHVGYRRVGPVPPLGPLLDPVRGVWAVATRPDLPAGPIHIPSATDTIRVVFDDRGVPHIFAHTEEDAARALGYVHAWFRLFQMELQTRATNGTLSEWLGSRALQFDRQQRALGLEWSAERNVAALDSSSHAGRMLLAYAQGVNARIDELGPRDLPLEYHLLNTRPAHWDILHSVLFLKRMGYTLSYGTPELRLARLAERLGPATAAGLVPLNSPIQEPIIPSRRRTPVLDPAVPPLPDAGGHAAASDDEPSTREASNNWVVSGKRTATGHPLLAGDPHLDLSLPSVWFEAHLVVPGVLDVYGVTFPGAPAVAIGFNRDVAWSFTNTGADVLDFYAETVDDSVRPSSYLLDGTWHPLERRVEEYRDPNGRVIATDTIAFTHRGPVRRALGRTLSMRWTVLDAGDDALGALLGIDAAHSVEEWVSAMRAFRAPIQNGVVADRSGNIAVLSAGDYPIRPPGGTGLSIWDGTTSASDWRGFLPPERQPYAKNPAQGYLASANQEPVDPAMDPTYLGADWPTPWRAMRINALLRSDSTVTPDDMREFQTDPGSARADWFVPAFLAAVARERQAGSASPNAIAAAKLLADWDRRYTKTNERAILFEGAMDALEQLLWDELADSTGTRVSHPGEDLTAALLSDPQSRWWDERATPNVVETRDDVLAAALDSAFARARARYGDPAAGGWRWSLLRHQNIWHPLRVPSLSRLDIPVQGGPGLLNPSSGFGTHGSSWRMVVDLGTEVRAWGVYPGGESGNPMSRWYADRVPRWADGLLDSLPFPATPDALPAVHRAGSVVIVGGDR